MAWSVSPLLGRFRALSVKRLTDGLTDFTPARGNIENTVDLLRILARPEGFEPSTHRSVVRLAGVHDCPSGRRSLGFSRFCFRPRPPCGCQSIGLAVKVAVKITTSVLNLPRRAGRLGCRCRTLTVTPTSRPALRLRASHALTRLRAALWLRPLWPTPKIDTIAMGLNVTAGG
jgi:hypothetical protein